MNELITTPLVELQTSNFCRACGGSLLPRDNFCGQCGAGCRDLIVPPIATGQYNDRPTEIATAGVAGSLQPVVNNRLFVVGAIVCAGPLGLLALWCSQSFTSRTKFITTLAYVLLVVVVPAALVCFILGGAFQPVAEALR